MLKLPVGYDNFGDILENKLDFIDKSLLIKELLDDNISKVVLITRPRRFGKTLNLSMVQYFFAAQVYGQATAGLFNDLKISQYPEIMQHQGKYPVIFITLKDVKASRYEKALALLRGVFAQLYQEHHYLLSSEKLTAVQKEEYLTVLKKDIGEDKVQMALKDLSGYLYQHFGEKVWVLIDEYDTPLQEAYFHHYLNPMLELMRGVFGSTLKKQSLFK